MFINIDMTSVAEQIHYLQNNKVSNDNTRLQSLYDELEDYDITAFTHREIYDLYKTVRALENPSESCVESVYIYNWYSRYHEPLVLYGFGYTKTGSRICVRVFGFMSACYIHYNTYLENQTLFESAYNENIKSFYPAHKKVIENKYKLARSNTSNETFLCLRYKYSLRNFTQQYNHPIYNAEVNRVTQFINVKGIVPHGWIDIVTDTPRTTLDIRSVISWPSYSCSHWGIFPCNTPLPIPKLYIASIDIECYSSKDAFPNALNYEDFISMISVYDGKSSYCLHIGPADTQPTDKDIIMMPYATESSMILGYLALMRRLDPDMIIGFNSYSFDFMYLGKRYELLGCESLELGRFAKDVPQFQKAVHFRNTAYGYNVFGVLSVESMIYFDVMQYCRKELRNENSWTLKALAKSYLSIDDQKHELSYSTLNQIMRTRDLTGYGEMAAYCVQDSKTTYMLYEKLQMYYSIVELGNITTTHFVDLYFKSTSTKILNHIYSTCFQYKIFLQDTHEPKIVYQGATVLPPEPRIYENVAVVDFKSLYPSIIIGYNICYTTFRGTVSDTSSYNPQLYHIITESRTRHHIFVKQPIGIIPRLLQRMVEERSAIKASIKTTKDPDEIIHLKVREKALKISANSIYGCFGMVNPKIYFLPGAESTTAVGRKLIIELRDTFETKMDCVVIYGDTDSCFVCLKDSVQLNDVTFSEYISTCCDKINASNAHGICLEYEKIYMRIILLGKKVYVGLKSLEYKDDIPYDGYIKYLDAKGTANVKSIYPPITKAFFTELAYKLLHHFTEDQIIQVIIKYIRAILMIDPPDLPEKKMYAYYNRCYTLLDDKMLRTNDVLNYELSLDDFATQLNFSDEKPYSTNSTQVFVAIQKESGYEYDPGSKIDSVITLPEDKNESLAVCRKITNLTKLSNISRVYYIRKMFVLCDKFNVTSSVFGSKFDNLRAWIRSELNSISVDIKW